MISLRRAVQRRGLIAAGVVALALAGCTGTSEQMAASLKDVDDTSSAAGRSPSLRASTSAPAAVTAPSQPKRSARPASAPTPRISADRQAVFAECKGSANCIAQLNAMIADPDQSWLKRAPTPAEFATGTRIFAYRALRTKLDCRKLALADAELKWAVTTFAEPVAGIGAELAQSILGLSRDAQSEVAAEIKARC